MSSITRDDFYMYLTDFINRKLDEKGRKPLQNIADDYDIFLSGAIDSLGFVELIAAAGKHFGREIDLADIDPENMTTVGALCTYVSEQFS